MPKIVQAILLTTVSMTIPLLGGETTLCPPGCGPGHWSTAAIDLSPAKMKAPYESRDITVDSPDRQKSLRVVKDHWWVEIAELKIFPPAEAAEILYPAEAAWAPDSRSLFITQSAGYSTGYRVDVYRISDSKLVQIHLSSIVARAFDRRHRCSDGQVSNDPNTAGFKWLDDSDRLLVVAEAPPVGVCKDANYFGGYEVSLTSRKILQSFSPQQLHDQWDGELGERLRDDLTLLSGDAKTKEP